MELFEEKAPGAPILGGGIFLERWRDDGAQGEGDIGAAWRSSLRINLFCMIHLKGA